MNIYCDAQLPASIIDGLGQRVTDDYIYSSTGDRLADHWWLTRKAHLYITNGSDSYNSGWERAWAEVIDLPTILYGKSAREAIQSSYLITVVDQTSLHHAVDQLAPEIDYPGLYIAFEGLNSSGKGTQLQLLTQYLQQSYDIYTCREPGTNYLGGELRRLIQAQYEEPPTPKTEAALFMGQRAQLIDTEIRQRLHAGQIVLADRSDGTSLAFQGQGRGLDIHRIGALNRYFVSQINPDIVIYLDAPLENLSTRQHDGEKEDRFEIQADDFHQLCYQGYHLAIKNDHLAKPYHWVSIDATQSIEAIHQQIVNQLSSALAHIPKNL